MLWVSSAWAIDVAEGDDLCDVVADNVGDGVTVEFLVTGDHSPDCTVIELGNSSVTFESSEPRDYATIPPIHATSTTLELYRIAFTGSADWQMPDAAQVDLGVTVPVSLAMNGGSIEADGVSVSAVDAAGAVLVGVAGTLDSFEASGMDAWPALYAAAFDDVAILYLHDVDVHDVSAGGLFLAGSGLSAFVTGNFGSVSGEGWGAVLADDVGYLEFGTVYFDDVEAHEDGTGLAAPLRMEGTESYCSFCEFTDCFGDGASAIALWETDFGWYLGTVRSRADAGPHGILALQESSLTAVNVDWTLSEDANPAIYAYDSDISFAESTFSGGGEGATVLDGSDGVFQFEDVFVCDVSASGAPMFGAQRNDAPTYLLFDRVTVQGSSGDHGIVKALGSPTLRVLDSTFADTDAVLVAGQWGEVILTNVLAANLRGGLDFYSEPSAGTGNYNLWYEAVHTAVPAGWGTDDVYADPEFDERYRAKDCSTRPRLSESSPAIDAGDPESLDSDLSRSDIGAWDYGVSSTDTGTTDTAVTDTDTDTGDTDVETTDSGEVAVDADGDGATSEDCDDADASRHPHAPEVPDDGIDQDCDGQDATLTLRGNCGCEGSSAAMFLPFLALRRRRR